MLLQYFKTSNVFIVPSLIAMAVTLNSCYSIDTLTMDNVNQSLNVTTDHNIVQLGKNKTGFFTGITIKMTKMPNCGITKIYAKPMLWQGGSVVALSKDMFDSSGGNLYVSVDNLPTSFKGQYYIDFHAVNTCEESHFITSIGIGRL